MKFFGKMQITISSTEANSQLVFDIDDVEIKKKFYEIKSTKTGKVIQKRPKQLIIIAKAEYPL